MLKVRRQLPNPKMLAIDVTGGARPRIGLAFGLCGSSLRLCGPGLYIARTARHSWTLFKCSVESFADVNVVDISLDIAFKDAFSQVRRWTPGFYTLWSSLFVKPKLSAKQRLHAFLHEEQSSSIMEKVFLGDASGRRSYCRIPLTSETSYAVGFLRFTEIDPATLPRRGYRQCRDSDGYKLSRRRR